MRKTLLISAWSRGNCRRWYVMQSWVVVGVCCGCVSYTSMSSSYPMPLLTLSSLQVANEYDLDDSFIASDESTFAWLEDSFTSSDPSSDEDWEGNNFCHGSAYNLRARPLSPVISALDDSDSQTTSLEGTSESNSDETVATIASTDDLLGSRSDSEQDKHFRAIRSRRRAQRLQPLLCEDEEDSEMEEVVHRRRKRKMVKPLTTSSDSEASSDVLSTNKGFKLTESPYFSNKSLSTSSPKTDHSICSLEKHSLAASGKEDNRGNDESTFKGNSNRNSVCHPPSHHTGQTSSFNQQKYTHSPPSSSKAKKRKRRMRQEDLFHFISSTSENNDVLDPLTLPLKPSSWSRSSPATNESFSVSKSCVRNHDSTSSSVLVQKKQPNKKFKPLQPNLQYIRQVSVSLRPTLIAISARNVPLENDQKRKTFI